jgi:hypothetical protein
MRHSAPLPRAIFPTPLCATKNPNFGPLLPKFPFAPVEITEIVFLHKFSDRKIWTFFLANPAAGWLWLRGEWVEWLCP